MSAALETVFAVVREEGQLQIQTKLRDEQGMSSTEAKHSNASSEAAAATIDGGSDGDSAGLQSPLNWEKSLSMWLSTVIGFFGQHFMNYITSVSEKMEKLEYY